MTYRVLNAEEAYGFWGTSLQGVIQADYEELVQVFGKPDPNLTDGYKTDVEWCVEVQEEDGHTHVVFIYNWKDGENYLGANGLRVWDMKEWHIGGKSPENVTQIREILESADKELQHRQAALFRKNRLMRHPAAREK
jgi:hypothetical protein